VGFSDSFMFLSCPSLIGQAASDLPTVRPTESVSQPQGLSETAKIVLWVDEAHPDKWVDIYHRQGGMDVRSTQARQAGL